MAYGTRKATSNYPATAIAGPNPLPGGFLTAGRGGYAVDKKGRYGRDIERKSVEIAGMNPPNQTGPSSEIDSLLADTVSKAVRGVATFRRG